ncbi:MAG TPA: WYL domain-containing protein [Thermoleophilaceae bacterium]|jgi:proteasome accessory factor C|nr:WYL domain-containing protein [Thermoleophilaceae bacterium]
MAKDTEKLIRQLSLISFLMAERRPVTALEIKQEVEGYSDMNDEAFARRFYADRAELGELGIELKVEKGTEGYYEAENYSLPPENFYLPPIEFTDEELAALRTALHLLDGRFAYAEPFRLALQQLSWGKASPLAAPEQNTVRLGVTAAAGGRELSQRLAKIETAIFRRKTIVFDYYTIGRDKQESRKVNPYHLLFRGGQFYLIGFSHERGDVRVFRLSRIRGKVAYVTKAEHDFHAAEDFDHREYATRTEWQLGQTSGTAQVWISKRIDWLVMRHFGHAGTVTKDSGGVLFETEYSDPRALVSWVLGLGEHARVVGPPELQQEAAERLERVIELHRGELDIAPPARRSKAATETGSESRRAEETPIRPERFARLVTLARILINAARHGEKLETPQLCKDLQISDTELREDIDVLNVVNFGGGSYVVYAEVHGDTIEVDPEPYGDNFATPARLLPLEAKALVAAIDLVGDHLPEGSLEDARKKVVDALGHDPVAEGLQITTAKGDDSDIARVLSRAIADHHLVKIDYYKENEDEETKNRLIEPYGLINGPEGWYVHAYDPKREDTRSFRLDRIKAVHPTDDEFEPREGIDLDVSGWPSTGEVPDARNARVWMSPERARWARETRTVAEELKDGALVVELPYAGTHYLAREILKEAGDAAVLEPEEARVAVLEAAEALAGAATR